MIVLTPQAILLFLPPQRSMLATGRQRLGLLQGQGTWERACPFPGGTVSCRDCSRHHLFLETTGKSRASTRLVLLAHQEPQASTLDQLSCFLSKSLTTTLEKQPGSAKNWQSPKSQNNDWPIQCFHPRNCWFRYKKTLWDESQESEKGMWLFLPHFGKKGKSIFDISYSAFK